MQKLSQSGGRDSEGKSYARALIVVSKGRGKAGQAGLVLASLNNFSGL